MERPLAMVALSLSTSVASAVTVTVSSMPETPRVASAVVSCASWTFALRVAVCMPGRVKVSV